MNLLPVQPNDTLQVLAAGECHWAIVSGLSDSHKSNTPIIADGFTDGIGRYDQHHVWSRLNKALVGRLDGSVRLEPITNGEILVPNTSTNLIDIPPISEDDLVEVLNPAPRPRASSR